MLLNAKRLYTFIINLVLNIINLRDSNLVVKEVGNGVREV